MLTKKSIYLAGCAPLCLASFAYGQANEEESFRISTFLDARAVKNAGLQASDEPDVSELQTRAGLLMFGQLQGRIYDFQSDYSLEARRYSEFSRRDDQVLLGESVLRVGNESRRHYLELGHSTREFLDNPEEANVPENRDRRTILSAGGYSSIYLGRPNTLALQVNASDIQFASEANEVNEASRVSAGLTLTRLVSSLHQLGLNVSGYHLNYRETDQQIDYAQAAVVWKGLTKNAEYSAEIGYNAMEREEDTLTSPLVRLNWTYQSAAQQFEVNVAQWLSDTSQGGNFNDLDQDAVGTDGRTQVVDQFKNSELSLRWTHVNLCGSCTVSVGFDVQEEEYYSNPEYSSREAFAAINTTYQVNASLGLQFNLLMGTYTAYEDDTSNDYATSRVNLAAVFPDLIRGGELSTYIGVEGRDFDNGDGYTSPYIGAQFEYMLFRR